MASFGVGFPLCAYKHQFRQTSTYQQKPTLLTFGIAAGIVIVTLLLIPSMDSANYRYIGYGYWYLLIFN
jgi:hypothetical protein